MVDNYGEVTFHLTIMQSLKLSTKRSPTGKASSSKKAKVLDDQVAFAASLPKHQGIPELFGHRTRKGQLEYEIKWVDWTSEPHTTLGNSSLTLLQLQAMKEWSLR